MPEVTTTSEKGFTSKNEIRDFESTIDATGETAPDTLEALLASYAACYVPALRVGGQQRGVDELGRIEITADGGLNEDEKLDSITFHVKIEENVDDDTVDQIVERADELCKVHDALKSSLDAKVNVETGAF